MPTAKRPRRARRTPAKRGAAPTAALQALRRRIKALEAARDAARRRHAKELAAVQRAADRRRAMMMREIAALRHLQARSDALVRLVGERDAALAAQAERITHLETLVTPPPEMR